MGIQQEIWKLEIEISYTQRWFQKDFADQIPAYIVDEEKEKLETLQRQHQELSQKLCEE